MSDKCPVCGADMDHIEQAQDGYVIVCDYCPACWPKSEERA
jgi:ssDNA-binding Zn-finger/Zn-ribbon topoisomerase 1